MHFCPALSDIPSRISPTFAKRTYSCIPVAQPSRPSDHALLSFLLAWTMEGMYGMYIHNDVDSAPLFVCFYLEIRSWAQVFIYGESGL